MQGVDESLAVTSGDAPLPKGFSLDALSPEALLRFADRRCRTAIDPSARDLLLRASVFRSLDRQEAALKDLRAAALREADDPMVARSQLALDPDEDRRAKAAHALLANPRASDADLDAALRFLVSIGTEIVIRAQRIGERISGWVARTTEGLPQAKMRHDEGSVPMRLKDCPTHSFPSFAGTVSTFAFDWDAQLPLEIVVKGQDGGLGRSSLYAVEPPDFVAGSCAMAADELTGLNVIVPLYRDFEATKACLEALALQECEVPLRFVLVDDHSPEAAISELATRFCRLHQGTLVTNSVNHGFAGAVNTAITVCEDGDYLLLNSDVTLPSDALDRLIRAAYGSADIGTVMPLSNDSEMTSFPRPFKPNPLPNAELAIRIDDAARQANGDSVVDIVNTIGYCVYIRRACLRETGLLSQSYGRGYYEDVEIALKAREKGFRNVAAVGLYVSHGSGRSFGEEKPGLVSRNLPILCSRFPNFRTESEAFVRADPLKAARGAIEARLPPREPTHLLVGAAAPPGSPTGFRAQRIAEEGGSVLMMSWRQVGASMLLDVRAPSGFGPRSLEFSLEAPELDRLNGYILSMQLVQIELCDLHTVPAPLYRMLLRTSAPILFLIASLEDAMLVETGAPSSGEERLTSRDITVDFLHFDSGADPFAYRVPHVLMRSASVAGASKFVTADAMAEAVCADGAKRRRGLGDAPTSPPFRLPERWEAKRLIAIPVPLTSPAVDRVLLDLARFLRPRVNTRLLVMGRCFDDRALLAIGNVHVTGPAAMEDYSFLLDIFGADALFLPYRTSLFGVIETLSDRVGLPRAYFDWSGGLMASRADDVVLDCRAEATLVCEIFARWCAQSGPTPGGRP